MFDLRGGTLAGLLVAVCAVTGTGVGQATAAERPAVRGTYGVDANSNVRTTPHVRKGTVVYTTTRSRPMDVDCWTRGDDVNSGGHHTNVWYSGAVWTGSRYLDDVYVWGGNVNTPHDPPQGLPHC
ncbi:hypothetical protein ACFWXK_37030 [Streptomyces sp. NPDC059070]|uniref:hypothetical protein n=1 Tax=Streptomyces sp. NPDC059070 TaxID=3346713 RepID=UPI0036B8BDCC